ncbi:MAG TPA: ATP synthase F1 subunit delta [Acidimicrobiales bacterium]|nr:ATP synthase F1 subunit delta [Acidimicrobiales bacterium]
MREAVRGYFDAVMETAGAEGRADVVAADLSALGRAVGSSEDLRAALSDPGLPSRARRAVVSDLLEGKVAPATAQLVSYVIEVDRAPEIVSDLAWLASSAAAAIAAGAPGDAGQPGQPGRRSGEVDMLGRSASRERIEGYSTAVLAPLAAAGGLSEVEDELFRFGRVVDSSEELKAVLTDREVPAERRAGLVRDLLGAKASPPSVRLATYTALYGRPRDYVASLSWLVDRVAAEANRRVAEVRSAVELDDDQRARLTQALSRITGRQVDVRVSVDRDLLGGFIASVGDTVVDGSARHRLELLKERLSLPQVDLLTGTGESS